MVGAGLLSLPWTMQQASLGPGVCAIVIMAVLNGASLVALAICCQATKTYSYKMIGELCFGRWAGLIIQTVVGLYAFGSCITYAVLVGSRPPPLSCSHPRSVQ